MEISRQEEWVEQEDSETDGNKKRQEEWVEKEDSETDGKK